ncbi:coiled-coil domain-containing protein 42 homolog [Belonocnema kinseyi]|uniref:coiled-coil domain-containing protein 42 homolog n=1 Tax=Belonocnema kinseyi TaxID=2817044 RepID=UPI00143DF182|nr:coiled-coil domain-containing protein 42 homolog [Belonocnema kinseyi]
MAPSHKGPRSLVHLAELTSDSQQAITEYFYSKQEDQIVEEYPEWEIPGSSPVAELMRARRELAQAENELQEKCIDQKTRRKNMDQQWSELKSKEQSLRQSFLKFNKLVKENCEKRERAENKIKEERDRQERRQEYIYELISNLEKLAATREKMKSYVNEYKKYQTYLERVVRETNEFKSIPEIFNRYETLIEAKEVLSESQDQSLAVLEEASTNMHEMTQTKSKMLMGLSNELAQLQGRYDRAKALAIRWETIVARIKATAAAKNLELTQMRSCCWNIYLQICKRKGVPIEVDRNDHEQQLLHIKRTILELKRIIKTARKKAIKASQAE